MTDEIKETNQKSPCMEDINKKVDAQVSRPDITIFSNTGIRNNIILVLIEDTQHSIPLHRKVAHFIFENSHKLISHSIYYNHQEERWEASLILQNGGGVYQA